MKCIAPIYTAYAAHMMRQDMNTPLDTEMCQKNCSVWSTQAYTYTQDEQACGVQT